MPLAGYEPATTKVEIGTDNFMAVRGLGLSDVAVLVREHFPDLDKLAELIFSDDSAAKSGAGLESVLLALVSQAPGFVANVIAIAAGEGSAKDAEKLPAPVQMRALFDIAELTFNEVGGVGKGLRMLAEHPLMGSLKKTIGQYRAARTKRTD